MTLQPHGAPIHDSHSLPILPPEPLFGRDADIASIHLALKAATAVLLHGPAGIGKTALAATIAATYTDQSGGVLWLDVAEDSTRSLLFRIARAYGVDPVTISADQIRQLLQNFRPLIVLDGPIHADSAREFVRSYAQGIPLLLTSPRLIPGPWTPHAVGPLRPSDAEAMLIHFSGAKLEVGSPDVNHLNNLLAGHALSIFVAGHQFATGNVQPAEFIAQMPPAPAGDANRATGVLMAAYRQLPSTLQGIMLLLGATFSSQISEELLADVAAAPVNVIAAAMRQLVTRGFVYQRAEYDQPVYMVHELTQAFAQAFLRGKNQLDPMRVRHLRGVVTYVKRYSASLDTDRLAIEMPTVLSASVYAAQNSQLEPLQQLIDLLQPTSEDSFVNARGFSPEQSWLRLLLEQPTIVESGLLALPEITLMKEIEAEEAEEAKTEPATSRTTVETPALRTVVPDISPIAPAEPPSNATVMAAQQAKAAGNKEEAITLFTQALEGLRGSGSEQLTVLESLVDLNLEQRHFENALTLIDQGLDLAQTEQDDKHEGWLLSRLGDLQALLGKEDGAESAYKEALNALRPVEDWLNIGMVLNKLSNLYMQQKRQEDAASILEQAVSIFERLGRTEDLINNLSRLADVHAEMLNWDQATTYLTQALNRVRNAGGVRDVFEQVSRLADLKEKSGNYQEALPHYQHALHLAFELDEPKAIGETLLALGRLMIDDGVQLNRVIQLLEAAFAYLPNNSDIQRLLKRAKTRQERLLKAGVDLLRPEENLREYARSAAQ